MVNKVFIIFSILICMVLLYGCDSETDYLEGEKISFSIDASESKIEYIVVSMPGSSLIKLIQNQDEIEEVLLQLNNIDVVKQDEDILDDEKVRNRFVYALGITVAFSNEGKTTYMLYTINEDGSVIIRDVDQNMYLSGKNAVNYEALASGFR